MGIKDLGAKNAYLKDYRIIKVSRGWACSGREVKYFDLLFKFVGSSFTRN